jgi:hypothetical protein
MRIAAGRRRQDSLERSCVPFGTTVLARSRRCASTRRPRPTPDRKRCSSRYTPRAWTQRRSRSASAHTFPMADIAEARRRLESGGVRGSTSSTCSARSGSQPRPNISRPGDCRDNGSIRPFMAVKLAPPVSPGPAIRGRKPARPCHSASGRPGAGPVQARPGLVRRITATSWRSSISFDDDAQPTDGTDKNERSGPTTAQERLDQPHSPADPDCPRRGGSARRSPSTTGPRLVACGNHARTRRRYCSGLGITATPGGKHDTG